jgi:hypothetical protein
VTVAAPITRTPLRTARELLDEALTNLRAIEDPNAPVAATECPGFSSPIPSPPRRAVNPIPCLSPPLFAFSQPPAATWPTSPTPSGAPHR